MTTFKAFLISTPTLNSQKNRKKKSFGLLGHLNQHIKWQIQNYRLSEENKRRAVY